MEDQSLVSIYGNNGRVFRSTFSCCCLFMLSFFLFSSLTGGRGAFGFPAAFRRRWFRIIGHRLRPATTTTTTTTTTTRTKKKEHSDTHAHFESDFEAAVERGRPLTRTPRRTPINQTRYTKLGKKKKTTTSASFGLFPRLDCADRDKREREREIERERERVDGGPSGLVCTKAESCAV